MKLSGYSGGYISNVEIQDIIADPNIKKRQIEDKEGDILIYSDTEYVGWLQPKNYLLRSARWLGLNFGGTVDWAVDLNYDFGKNGDGDIDWPGEDEIEEACDFSREFKDMADLDKNGKNLPLLCRQVATLQVLDKMLSGLWTQYKEVNEGYDDKFKSYIKFVNNMIPGAIDSKMWDSTSRRFAKGFDCKLDHPSQASSPNKTLTDFECTRKAANGRINAGPMPCNELSRDNIAVGGYFMHMRMTDKEGFLKYIAEAGIPEDWITFDGTADFGEDCHLPAGPNPQCPTTSGTKDYVGYPKKKSSIEVPNPKDIVTDGIGNVDELRNIIVGRRLEISLGIYQGAPDDVIQVVSVPVFLLEQAIDGMIKAKELGDKQDEMDRDAQKNLILTIVGAVLFIVPFVGVGGAAALGATSLARVLLVIGEAANIAYTVYTVVDDPDSALMAVMGLLLGAAGMRAPRTPQGFRQMATKRTKLTGTNSLGEGFKARDDMLQRIVASTCKR